MKNIPPFALSLSKCSAIILRQAQDERIVWYFSNYSNPNSTFQLTLSVVRKAGVTRAFAEYG
ncbi:hypothetical protein [uncultured Endozoicomonas sp.]|uniref:hypothetical protein n=1 Tax=uncultured Endozoicomonas sp. TaxID=432652 RepID=UPI00262653B8|nr:hypothetical protein [uncultured Endozoicomonas sp.]